MLTEGLNDADILAIAQTCDHDPAILALRKMMKQCTQRNTKYAIDHPNISQDAGKDHVFYRLGIAAGAEHLEQIINECKEGVKT